MGKEGKRIEALLRNRIFCPQCGRPLVLRGRRSDDGSKFYYNCSRVAHVSRYKPCTYRRFVPGEWDRTAWDCIYAFLKDESLIKSQLSEISEQNANIGKLIKLEEQKVILVQAKIGKVREGFEGGLYNLEEAKSKIQSYQEVIEKAEQRILELNGSAGNEKPAINIEELEKELRRLADCNLENATFTEKRDVLSKLGIRVYPTEDLKTMRVRCTLNTGNGSGEPSGECVIMRIGSALHSSQ